MLYSDQSVLEMHHLATAFRLLRQKDCNIVAGLGARPATGPSSMGSTSPLRSGAYCFEGFLARRHANGEGDGEAGKDDAEGQAGVDPLRGA